MDGSTNFHDFNRINAALQKGFPLQNSHRLKLVSNCIREIG